MNAREQEAIILNAAWDMIDGMVNAAMFGELSRSHNVSLRFETRQHRMLFSILLTDFLSHLTAFKGDPIPLGLRAPPREARPADLTFLYYLRQVCDAPQFGSDVELLKTHIEGFASWLEGEFTAHNVNIHNLDQAVDITVARYRYLKICGDISKHNLARLATNVGHIRTLLKNAGQDVSEQAAYLSVESFYEWFFDDIFVGHASMIGECLNNIRWAIYLYAHAEFQRSHVLIDLPDGSGQKIYSYNVPEDITEPVARAMYWDLLNRVRRSPWVKPFAVSEFWRTYN